MIFPRNAIVHRVPDELPIELAVLVEPVSCAVHAVERARIEFGDLVVISGTGSIGLAMVGLARLKGAGTVVAVDLSEERLPMARSFGAHVTLNPRLVDAVQAVRELSDGGIGCDVYIESSGSPKSVLQGLEMLRKLGRFVEFSVFGEPTTVDWSIIGNKEGAGYLRFAPGALCLPGSHRPHGARGATHGRCRDSLPAAGAVARGPRPCHRRDPLDQGGHTTMTGPLETRRR
jgi:erythritol/L-threitol dehydrogenase